MIPHYSTRRVYVAAPWFDRVRARTFADRLVGNGHQLTSTWWGWGVADEKKDLTSQGRLMFACDLSWSIRCCDVFVHLPVDREQRGGNYVDLGMAIGYGKPILSVGWTVLSHAHPLVRVVGTETEAVQVLRDSQVTVTPWNPHQNGMSAAAWWPNPETK